MINETASSERCLADFLANGDYLKRRALLVEITPKETSASTVDAWQQGKTLPRGIDNVKVRVLLDLAGYTVMEFQEIPEVTRQLARLIAFDIYTLDEVREELKYSNPQEVYRVILKGAGLNGDRQDSMKALVEVGADDIESKANVWQRKLALVGVETEVVQAETPVLTKPSATRYTASSDGAFEPSPMSLLQGALQKACWLADIHGDSPEAIAMIRKEFSVHELYALRNLLNKVLNG